MPKGLVKVLLTLNVQIDLEDISLWNFDEWIIMISLCIVDTTDR